MNRRNILKILILMFVFIILQTYFQDIKAFKIVVSKWAGYLKPVIWSIFIATLLNPAVDFLEKKFKINRVVSIVLVLAVILLFIVGMFVMLIPEFVISIKELNELYPYIVERATEISKKIILYLAEKDILVLNQEEILKNTNNLIKSNFNDIQKFVVSILENVVWWTMEVVNFLVGLFLAILILVDKRLQTITKDNIVRVVFGQKNKDYIINKIKDSNVIFINYVLGKLIVSFFVGISVFLILKITKTPYASLSAILLGVGNMIPYVGSIIGGIIAIFLIFIIAPMKAIFLILAIIVSQLLDGFVIGPKIIGDKVGLNTFWVMISVLIFGGLFGVVGMFLGVPIMCIIKLFYADILKKREI